MMSGSQVPIDIHCSKLVDWLIQRRHCTKDWSENLAVIRRKIKAALRDMPENEEIKQLLIGSKLDYFKSKRIVELLKTTEASSKNIFGFYSSQRMKDWQDIVYSYEKNNVYLAEIATDLIRENSYEVPGIRKVINRLNKERDEAEKDRANLLRRAQQFNSEYNKLAQSYGIKGVNVERELIEESKSLSNVMEEIVQLSKDLGQDVEYYNDYAKSTSKQEISEFLPLLKYVIQKGNTTFYEYKHGEAPTRVDIVEVAKSTAGNSNSSEIELVDDEIDFGEDKIDFGEDKIDFGEDIPSSESSSGFVHLPNSDKTNDQTLTMEVIDSKATENSDDKIARGDEAKPVLAFRKSRNQFLNNLYELEAFFVEQLNDSATSQDRASQTRRYESNEINLVLTKIRKIISIINKEKNMILFQMNDSQTFVDNLKDKFSKKSKQAADCNVKADLLMTHIKDLEDQTRETELHLRRSIVSAKELQEKVETSIRELYGGRPINVMGCVN